MTRNARELDWNPRNLPGDRTPAFDRMRETCPVAYSEKLGWSVFRYDDVVAVSRDVQTFSNSRTAPGVAEPNGTPSIPLDLDPPEHTKYRRLLQPLFSGARMRAFEPKMEALAAIDVDRLLASHEPDVMAEFADPFPVRVLAAFLGWDADDWRYIKQMAAEYRAALLPRDPQRMEAAQAAWRDYIAPVVAARREAPRDDATSWLLAQSIDDRPLTDLELHGMIRLLLQAGHGTSTASFGKMIRFLAENPAEQDLLRGQPDLIPRAIEELLRFSGPLIAMERTVLRETVLGGRQLHAGDKLYLNYIAANRDEQAFANARHCDLARNPNRHLAFGSGIHTCVGSPLARLELRVALTTLLARTQSFELAETEVEYNAESWPTDDLRSLKVRFAGASKK